MQISFSLSSSFSFSSLSPLPFSSSSSFSFSSLSPPIHNFVGHGFSHTSAIVRAVLHFYLKYPWQNYSRYQHAALDFFSWSTTRTRNLTSKWAYHQLSGLNCQHCYLHTLCYPNKLFYGLTIITKFRFSGFEYNYISAKLVYRQSGPLWCGVADLPG